MHRTLCVLLLCVAVSLVAGAGCATGPKSADEAAGAASAGFLEEIPANSPYLVATLEPIPEDVVEPYLAAGSESLGLVEDEIERATISGRRAASPGNRILLALVDEFEDVESAQDLEELGISPRLRVAWYGIGWFPVIRVAIDDADAVEATIDRIEEESEVESVDEAVGGVDLRTFDLEHDGQLAIGTTEDTLLIGVSTQSAFESFLPYMVGEERPEETLADIDRVQRIADRHGFVPSAIGYLDTDTLLAASIGPLKDGEVTDEVVDGDPVDGVELSEACREDVARLTESVPRVAFGATELSESVLEVKAVAEAEAELNETLSGLQAPIPAYERDIFEEAVLAVGLGVDVREAVDVWSDGFGQMQGESYECERFAGLNTMGRSTQQIRAMIPNFAMNIRGFAGIASDISVDQATSRVDWLEGLAVVATRYPRDLWTQIQQWVAQLQQVDLQADGEPVVVEELEEQEPLEEPSLAMNDRFLGASAGAEMRDELADLMGEQEQDEALPATPYFSVVYDRERGGDQLQEATRASVGQRGRAAFDAAAGLFKVIRFEIALDEEGPMLRLRGDVDPDRQ